MSDTIGMFGETQWGSGPAVQATRLDEGAMFADRYEIKRELGAGGMGVVYLAQDTLTNREIVLKLIHPSLVDDRAAARMIEEGVLASQIRHPNVVAVHHIDRVDGQTFLTMEYVEGKTLRQWIGENVVSQRETPVDQAVAVVREILKGLSAAHGAGIVHRDLKPENILLTGDPGAGDFGLKILDFGIARGFKTEVFTSSTPAMGTPLYMAPEQKTMPDAAGPSADLYSVGRIFYELLMDVLPDGASAPPSEQRQDLPKTLDAVLAKAANTRPKARYQSAEEFMAAIDEAVAKPAEPETPVVPEKNEKKPEPEEKKSQSDFEENKEKVRQGLIGLLPKDEADSNDAILEVRAGTGGDEAALFAGDLFRMYQRYAELQGWKVEILSASEGEVGGYKEVIASVSGENVFAKLKFESGVHRVQRVPATESGGRIHTSAATVAVLPQAENVDIDVQESDLRIDTYRASGAGGQHVNTTDSAVRITHLPTGIVVAVQDERSQHKNKARAMQLLRARIYDEERERAASERTEARRLQVGSGDRSERIRTYNYPQGRVTDHRIGLTLYKLEQILSGEALGEVIEPLTLDHQANLLATEEA